MSLRRATTVLLVVAQVATGAYLVVYLLRWQWNRALICGVLFVATEILLLGRLVLERLRALEARLDAAPSSPAAVEVRLVENRPEPSDRFRWLRESTTRTNVFLPVLLGAGVLASAAAWAVEGVARRTARPALERSLAAALAPVAFPAGGLLGPRAARPEAPRLGWRQAGIVGAGALVVTAIGLAVDVVADATQTRPDRLESGVTTLVDLRFRGDRALDNPTRHAADLVGVCTSQSFSREIEAVAIFMTGPDTVRVVLDADLGDRGSVRLRGCLEDLTLDRIQASVTSISEVPPNPVDEGTGG